MHCADVTACFQLVCKLCTTISDDCSVIGLNNLSYACFFFTKVIFPRLRISKFRDGLPASAACNMANSCAELVALVTLHLGISTRSQWPIKEEAMDSDQYASIVCAFTSTEVELT
eukprot:scpid21924/ scgid34887/ 